MLYKLLNNRVYIGEAVHKGVSYPGEHEAIIDRKLWDQVHAILKESPRKRAASARAQTPALLKGLLFGPDGAAMSPTHTRKGGAALSLLHQPERHEAGRPRPVPSKQVPAAEIERIVIDQIRSLLQTPEVIVQTWRAAERPTRSHRERRPRRPCLSSNRSGTSYSRPSRPASSSCWSNASICSLTASTCVCASRG